MGGAALEFGTSKPVTALRDWFSLAFSARAISEVILKLAMKIQLLKWIMNILEVILETSIICHEGFSTVGHDPPCIPRPVVTLQPDSVTLQAPPGHSTAWHWGTHGTLDSYCMGLRSCLSALCLMAFQEWEGMSEPSSVVTEFNSATASSGVCKGAAITPGVPGRLQLQSICSEGLTTSWPLPNHFPGTPEMTFSFETLSNFSLVLQALVAWQAR